MYSFPPCYPLPSCRKYTNVVLFRITSGLFSFLLYFLFLLHRLYITSIKKNKYLCITYLICIAMLAKKSKEICSSINSLQIKLFFFYFYQLDILIKTHLILKTDQAHPSHHITTV